MPEPMSVEAGRKKFYDDRRRRWEESTADRIEANQKAIRDYEAYRVAQLRAACDEDPELTYDEKAGEIRLTSEMKQQGVTDRDAIFCLLACIGILLFLGILRIGFSLLNYI